jgi:hypothetical protein
MRLLLINMLQDLIKAKQKAAYRSSRFVTLIVRCAYHQTRLRVSQLRIAIARLQGSLPDSPCPNKSTITWLAEYYHSPDRSRQSEINRSLIANSRLSWLTHCLVAYEINTIKHPPFRHVPLYRERLAFADYLKIVRSESCEDACGVFILCNSDIELTNDVLRLTPWIRKGDLIALSRREDGMIGFEHSPETFQDCWIMCSQMISWDIIDECNFHLGIPGCDNRFAAVMHKAGFQIWNPCINTSILHHHRSAVRTGVNKRLKGLYYEPFACSLEDYIMRKSPGGSLKYVI